MNGPRILRQGWGMAALCGSLLSSIASGQTPPPLEPPTNSPSIPAYPVTPNAPTVDAVSPDLAPIPAATPEATSTPADDSLPRFAALPPSDDRPIRPATEGPLHEAFLSPPKDREPTYFDKAPPSPVNERPGVDPPGDKAVWIPGYWEWNPGQKDYVWTTGT